MTQYNYQINPSHDRKAWEEVNPVKRCYRDIKKAIAIARRTATLYKAEVRLTAGRSHDRSSGSYFKGY